MAAFETTSVAIARADQPTIVQRFIATSERFLFHPPSAPLVRVQAPFRCVVVLHDDARFCLPSPRGGQAGAQGRAAA